MVNTKPWFHNIPISTPFLCVCVCELCACVSAKIKGTENFPALHAFSMAAAWYNTQHVCCILLSIMWMYCLHGRNTLLHRADFRVLIGINCSEKMHAGSFFFKENNVCFSMYVSHNGSENYPPQSLLFLPFRIQEHLQARFSVICQDSMFNKSLITIPFFLNERSLCLCLPVLGVYRYIANVRLSLSVCVCVCPCLSVLLWI